MRLIDTNGREIKPGGVIQDKDNEIHVFRIVTRTARQCPDGMIVTDHGEVPVSRFNDLEVID